MNKRTRIILIVVGLAVAAYLAYRWYAAKSSSTATGNATLGTNLNSVAPELIAGSSGPSSGLNYTAPATTIYLTMPTTTQTASNMTGKPISQGTPSEQPG